MADKTFSMKDTVKALGQRTTGMMFTYGFASGLPYALAIGTLNAWLGEVGIDLTTIGVLSWIGLAYAFKFLWSPAVDRVRLPLLWRIGQRRSWIVFGQLLIAVCLAVIAATDPKTNLGLFALAAVVMAFASATQDMAVDAWRIESADAQTPLDLLSAVYQFGYRIASLLGGAGALMLADRMAWGSVYGVMAGCMILALIGGLRAPEPPEPAGRPLAEALRNAGELQPRVRHMALGAVLIGWGWAIWVLGSFMTAVMTADPDAAVKPDAKAFTQKMAPWIVFATVVWPAIISAILNRLKLQADNIARVSLPPATGLSAVGDRLYSAIVLPQAELIGRLGWAAILATCVIVTYRLTDLIWGPFAFPFYLGELKYSKDEVAIASKIIGVVMTIVGISLGAYALLKIGRMATLTAGAVFAAITNLLYVDLATGGHSLDAFLGFTGLHTVLGWVGLDDRMGRLVLAISVENIAVGFASTASVVYISSITSKAFSTVQYALLASLTFLVGSLGRGALGQAIEEQGYAYVFYVATALGGVGVFFCICEWIRQAGVDRRAARVAEGQQDAVIAAK
jgi:MFS transporter, PAT family, beta-lactamase induction signal transducer AmpG